MYSNINNLKGLQRDRVEKITDFLTVLLKFSFQSSIKQHGYFDVFNEHTISSCDENADEEGDYFVGIGDRFSDEIESKYQLQIHTCYQNDPYATEHVVSISIKGWLAEIFIENDIGTSFEVWLNNGDGNPKHTMFNVERFSEDIYFPGFNSLEKARLDDFDVLYEKITKPFLFDIMKDH